MSYENNLKTLQQVNDLLGDLSQEIVYVGGITTFLYVDVAIADDIRPTKDVDFVLESANKKDYDQFQKKLREIGFSNSWYKEGIKHKEKVKIGKKEIYIFTLPYFLASKFEAFNSRGKSDPRMSWDLEDIILIIDGIKDFQIPTLSKKLKSFLSEMSSLCVSNKNMQEAISGFLKHNPQKLNKVNERLKSLISKTT